MCRIFCATFSLLLFVLIVSSERVSSSIVRQTANGPVAGIEKISSLGQNYYAFRGIPFAEPPITGMDPYTGEEVDRRFKAPEPLQRTWTEPLDASEFGPFCIAVGADTNSTDYSEDCLFINVYVPVGGRENKTVLAFIHGGAFMVEDSGDSKYGPDFLLSLDNIVVAFEYRLGIFGFLNLNTPEYSGNMGLKDQQLALKWIYENIENFSGNKDEILLFGQSAGGASVHYQMLNEQSRKYFKRALLLSSSAFCSYALRRSNHVEAIKGCFPVKSMFGIRNLMKHLKKEEPSRLLWCYPIWSGLVPWVPTIENLAAIRPFLTKEPSDIYNSDITPVMDTMFTFTSKESIRGLPTFFATKPFMKEDAKQTNFPLPFEGFNKKRHPTEYQKAVEMLRNDYFPNTDDDNDAVRSANVDFISDSFFTMGILKAVIHQTIANNNRTHKNEPKNTFFLRFSVHDALNTFKLDAHKNYNGATHTDDLCYIFHAHQYDKNKIYEKHLERKDRPYGTIMRMVKMITNFARTGNPSIEGDTPFESCKSENEIFCQEMSNDPQTRVTSDIKKQLHYDVWHEVENIYNSIRD